MSTRFSLPVAGILLTISSVGALAQMNSPPPTATTKPHLPSAAGQAPVSNSGNDVNFPGNNMANPLGAPPANPNR